MEEETYQDKLNFTQVQHNQIVRKGKTIEEIESELNFFINGILKINLEKPATITNGILVFDLEKINSNIQFFEDKKNYIIIEKFIPASGAASRMFKFLITFLHDYLPEQETINAYINRSKNYELSVFIVAMEKLPFFDLIYTDLKNNLVDFDSFSADKKNYLFIQAMLNENNFNFTKKPKGILPFHKDKTTTKTAFEEHLIQALQFKNVNKKAKIHATISAEFENYFEKISNKYKNEIDVVFSEQLAKTDTIAVNENNEPLLENDTFIFRPGGHGALIYNLNQVQSDLVFIKNIDNVSMHYLNENTNSTKNLAGYLLTIQNEIHTYLKVLESEQLNKTELKNIRKFIKTNLFLTVSKSFKNLKKSKQQDYLFKLLHRPIRVCGMVQNENEPGGGPFWVRNRKGFLTLQIVESAQVDFNNSNQEKIFNQATHFNSVDLVCGLKNHKNEKYNLLDFIDQKSGFIVNKSKGNLNYKAYELPGLWNGAMAKWITIFVEVPLHTFNPVKTVNDLLKPNHQP